jgi:AraC family transcriptional regulator, transcriptional activator of pobA
MTERPIAFREQTQLPNPSFPINIFNIRPSASPLIPPHWHEHTEWIWVRSGAFRVRLESRSEALGPGCVAFVPPQLVHSAVPIEEGSELLAVVFSETLVRSAALDDAETRGSLPLLRRGAGSPLFLRPDSAAAPRVAQALSRIESELRGGAPGFELFIKASLIECLAELRRAVPDEGGAAPSRAEAAIAALLRRLCLEYMESLGVAEAAAECGLSVSHFCHAFKKATGTTLVRYLRSLRVIEAERMLSTGGMSVAAIAASVGFDDPAYFGRVFRAMTGSSPRQARSGSRAPG